MTVEVSSDNCELILGLVAPVGVDLDKFLLSMKSYFQQFSYTVNFIHLSKLSEKLHSGGEVVGSEVDRLDRGMDKGSYLRARYKRGDYYALLAIQEINKSRPLEEGHLKPLYRQVHVIRSLKHPDEVQTLRQVYGPGFFLLGVTSSIKSRRHHLEEEKGVPEGEVDRLIDRDDKEKGDFGQNTSGVFQMADAFVRSDVENVSNQIGRILDLLFSSPKIFPTADEYAMFMAYAASLRSADLSRQVGAVITNKHDDILATGANDVPKFGGGLYWPTEGDKRDYVKGLDSNEIERNNIVLNIMKKIFPEDSREDKELIEDGKKLLKDTGVLGITEYGRAVHAEMEALLSAARNGVSTRECTLFTTTYPCHNCAKHIIASGVTKVKYIEPYPKSYAKILHGDEIEDTGLGAESRDKVIFEPFVGVGPRRFVDLFSMTWSSGRQLYRKENGILADWKRLGANLRVPLSPLSYIETETKVIEEFEIEARKEEGKDE